MKKEDAAFPNAYYSAQLGMSLLDYFAGQALAGLVAYGHREKVEERAYTIAKEMLKEREKYNA